MTAADTYLSLKHYGTPINDQPAQVCNDCGTLWGRYVRPNQISTYWLGTCGVCSTKKAVTDPRDYGYLRPGWRQR